MVDSGQRCTVCNASYVEVGASCSVCSTPYPESIARVDTLSAIGNDRHTTVKFGSSEPKMWKSLNVRCKKNHDFVILPNHPCTADGDPKCPHCMSIELDAFHKREAFVTGRLKM